MDLLSYLLSRKYTDNSIKGISGILAGKNCTIESATKQDGVTTVVFGWTDDDGTKKTTQIQVNDGETPAITSTEITGGHRITFTTTNPAQSISFDVMDGSGSAYDDTEIKQDITDIWKVQGELGAKNLIVYPYYGTPRNYEGIEFTDSNGVITINGFPSRAAYYNLRTQEPIYLKKGKYIASVSNPLGNDIHFQVIYNDGSGEKSLVSITKDTLSQEFTLTDDIISNTTYWVVRIAVLANTQVENLVVYPMIRYKSDTDDTWQPYAPTNYQLNQKVDTAAGVYLPNATNTSSKKVVASIGQTSVTFDANSFMTRYNVTASDLDLDISAETASGDVVAYNNASVTGGIVTVTFDALAEQTTFICKCSVIQ